jgi:hypothetical protein
VKRFHNFQMCSQRFLTLNGIYNPEG